MNIWLFALAISLAWGLVKLVKFMVTDSENSATNVDSFFRGNTQTRRPTEVTITNNQTMVFNTSSTGTSSIDDYFMYGIPSAYDTYEMPEWAEAGELVVDVETDELWVIVCEYVGRTEDDRPIGMLQVEHYEIDGLENEFTIEEVDPYNGEME